MIAYHFKHRTTSQELLADGESLLHSLIESSGFNPAQTYREIIRVQLVQVSKSAPLMAEVSTKTPQQDKPILDKIELTPQWERLKSTYKTDKARALYLLLLWAGQGQEMFADSPRFRYMQLETGDTPIMNGLYASRVFCSVQKATSDHIIPITITPSTYKIAKAQLLSAETMLANKLSGDSKSQQLSVLSTADATKEHAPPQAERRSPTMESIAQAQLAIFGIKGEVAMSNMNFNREQKELYYKFKVK